MLATKKSNGNSKSSKNKKLRLGGGPVLTEKAVTHFKNQAAQLARVEGVECTLTRFLSLLGQTEADFVSIIRNGQHAAPGH